MAICALKVATCILVTWIDMLIDSHSHIDGEGFTEDIPEIFARMRENKVMGSLIAGCSLNEYSRGLNFVKKHPNLWYAVGVHPSTTTDDHEPTTDGLCSLTADKKVVAIGECGLDFYYDDVKKDKQISRFKIQIEAAKRVNLPLIIHSRDARQLTIDLLREGGASSFVLHCFTGDKKMAKAALDMGGYISFSGILTFKNAQEIQEVAAWMPHDRMLVETDCPYLAPIPYRGKRNEPSYVKFVAEKLAELRSDSLENISKTTTENFFKLFKKATLCLDNQ